MEICGIFQMPKDTSLISGGLESRVVLIVHLSPTSGIYNSESILLSVNTFSIGPRL